MPPVSAAPVVVLSKPSCVQCKATYRELDKHKIPYEIIDMSQDLTALDYALSLGHQSAPVVVADGDNWSGFRPDKIAEVKDRLEAEGRLF